MKWIWTIIAVVVILLIAWFGFNSSTSTTETNPEAESVAVWLETSGVKFYGAFWCPACKAQKEIFGKFAKDLPYIECSTPDGSFQLKICEKDQEDIERYPTWEFTDGSRVEGVLSIDQLKEKSDYPEPVIGAQLDE